MKSATVFFSVLIVTIVACKKPSYVDDASYSYQGTSIVFYTSLADTLPEKTFMELAIKDVMGVKVNTLDSQDVRYFEYSANPTKVLEAIGRMGFTNRATLADITCRKTDLHELRIQLEARQIYMPSNFELALDGDYEAYECVKGSMINHIFIRKNSNKILHRIEFRS